MIQQIPQVVVLGGGAALALLALFMFWRLAARTVAAEAALHAGPAFLRRIARNALTPLLAVVVARILSWAFAAYYLRVIGPQDYGLYAIAVNIIGYFGPLTDFGLGVLLTREVSRRPDAAPAYLALVQRIRLLLSLAAVPVVLLIMLGYWYADRVPVDAIVTAGLLAVALIPANAAGTASSLFAARERMDYTALVQIATALLTVGLGTAAIALGWGYVGLAATALVANIVTAAVLLRALPRETAPATPWDPRLARALMLASLPLMLNALLNVLFFRIDIQVLAAMRDITEVGAYGAAYKYVEAFALLPSTLVLALFPALSRVAETDRAALQGIVNKALQLMLVMAVGSAVCFSFYAASFTWLLGGDEFLPHAARALMILIWFLPFSYTNAITQYVLIALDQQKWIFFAFWARYRLQFAYECHLHPALRLYGGRSHDGAFRTRAARAVHRGGAPPARFTAYLRRGMAAAAGGCRHGGRSLAGARRSRVGGHYAVRRNLSRFGGRARRTATRGLSALLGSRGAARSTKA